MKKHLLLLVLLIAGLLSGCGSKGTNPTPDNNNNPPGNTGPTATVSSVDAGGALHDLDFDASGNMYIGAGSSIKKKSPSGDIVNIATRELGIPPIDGSAYLPLTTSSNICVDVAGNIYVASPSDYKIVKITPSKVVTVLAGTGIRGSANGPGASATFQNLNDIAVDNTGNVYVVENSTDKIRKITPSGEVSDFAGSTDGSVDGQGINAKFTNIRRIATDVSGNIYVTDDQAVRKITPTGLVSTIAGSNTRAGFADGPAATARFYNPNGIAVDASGNIYVADYNNNKVRKITPSGTVSTLAGSGAYGAFGGLPNNDGPALSATIEFPTSLAIDPAGNVYVITSSALRKITISN